MDKIEDIMKIGKVVNKGSQEFVLVCPECSEEIKIDNVIPTVNGKNYYLICPKCKINVEVDINELRYLKK